MASITWDMASLSVQERFVRTEISFGQTKNRGSMPIGLGGRSFPVVRLAGWQADKNLIRVLI